MEGMADGTWHTAVGIDVVVVETYEIDAAIGEILGGLSGEGDEFGLIAIFGKEARIFGFEKDTRTGKNVMGDELFVGDVRSGCFDGNNTARAINLR